MGYEGDAVVWTRTTFDEAIQPGAKTLRHEPPAVLDQRRAQGERRHVDPVLHEQPGDRRARGFCRRRVPPPSPTSKDVKFGAQAGTTSLDFINEVIQPTQDVFVYDDNVGAKAALEANQIDAAVFDLPTALVRVGRRDRGQQSSSASSPPRPAAPPTSSASCSTRTAPSPVASTTRSPRSPTPANSTRSSRSGCRTPPEHRSSRSMTGHRVDRHAIRCRHRPARRLRAGAATSAAI